MLLNNEALLGYVTLRVKDLKMMTQFYNETIGLQIINETETRVMLGVDNRKIVELITSKDVKQATKAYNGLYHLAILLPDERYLGQILYHFDAVGFDIGGAGDHIYSQALYMNDPEGNGIEIYADRPRSEWLVNEDGTMEAATEPVDIQRLVSLVTDPTWYGMPAGTILGHAHLQVNAIRDARDLYLDRLGYDLITDMQHAIFISKRGYHHDIALNVWSGPSLTPLPEDTTGLASVTIYVNNLETIKADLQALENYSYTVSDDTVEIVDKAGIHLKLTVL